MGGHLDGMQAQPLQGLQRNVERRGLDHHGVTRPRHRAQAQVQSLHCAVGQDDLVGGHGQALAHIALGDLALEPQVPRREVVNHVPGLESTRARDQRAAQSVERKQLRAQESRAERHDVARAGGTEDRADQVVDLDGLGSRLWLEGSRFREQRAVGACGDEIA